MYQVAIIGCGGMGNWHYDQITKNNSDLVIKGGFDLRAEAMESLEKRGLVCYTSVEEILADSEITLVVIATPNNFHKNLSIACLKAGKHVVCEKPVTMNAKELEEIIAVAKETGKLFTVHQNRRWDKDYCIIKDIVAKNTLGAPYFIESRVLGSRGSMHGWRGYKENGGGMLLDWGPHLIDQVIQLIDSPVIELDGHLLSIFTPEVDDSIKLILRFENGVTAILEMATNCFINQPRWHMSCYDGTAVIEDWSCNGKMVQNKIGSEMLWADDIVYTEAGPTRTMAPRPKEAMVESPLPQVETNLNEFYENVVDVINGKAQLLIKPEESLRVMKIIDGLFASNEAKCAITCRI